MSELRAMFIAPPEISGATVSWVLNGKLSKEIIRRQMMELHKQDGFAGISPIAYFYNNPVTDPEYLTESFFEMYGCLLDAAKEFGLNVVFYDDCDWPSGTAGQKMAEQHPDDLMKYLARGIAEVVGPCETIISVPSGVVMSVVATNLETGRNRVVTSEIKCNWSDWPFVVNQNSFRGAPGDQLSALSWPAPAGHWKVQAFVCAIAPNRKFVDCLDPKAMKKFIHLTYEPYYQRFPSHFGSTIRMTFYDDLSNYHVPDCLAWSPSFNDEFKERFGRSPEALYPALWEDIGPDTCTARACLYGLRNELFAAGYPRCVEEWCSEKDVQCSGHPASSYRANPLQSTGDAILFYKYQGVPLTDYIGYYCQGVDGFKIPASAAYNYDRQLMVCETYAAFPVRQTKVDAKMLYRAAMQVYTRGINFIIANCRWLDPDNVTMPPEISGRNPELSSELPRYNRWVARCETLLRAGRHVADIGILYPIDDIAARYYVGLMPFTSGQDPVPGTDYYEISRILTGEIKRDFTFLHPEILDARCRVDNDELLLDNQNNWEKYQVLILPACRTIRLSNLRKIRDFLAAGGNVIATTCLPEKSVEFGCDAEVRRLTEEMFGVGGSGIFLPEPTENSLRLTLDGIKIAWDVRIDNATDIPRELRKAAGSYDEKVVRNPEWYQSGNREFAYIHRSCDGSEFYFFSNSSDFRVSADVRLRGQMTLECWDPHTGTIGCQNAEISIENGRPVTQFKLELAPVRSVFVVGQKRGCM